MFKVTFTFENGSEVEAFANAGDNLLEVARGANVAIDAPCSGNGACGKCRVQLKGGELDSKKTLHISDEEFEKGWRLACMSKISRGCGSTGAGYRICIQEQNESGRLKF